MHEQDNYPVREAARARSTSAWRAAPATTSTSRALDGALARAARARCPTSCSIWPAPIPTPTTSSAGWRSRSTGCGGATGWCSRPPAAPACRSWCVLAGGYARQVDDTVAIHAATIERGRATAAERLAARSGAAGPARPRSSCRRSRRWQSSRRTSASGEGARLDHLVVVLAARSSPAPARVRSVQR